MFTAFISPIPGAPFRQADLGRSRPTATRNCSSYFGNYTKVLFAQTMMNNWLRMAKAAERLGLAYEYPSPATELESILLRHDWPIQ
jgi:hypothetical protein